MIFDKMANASDYFEEYPDMKLVAKFAEDFEKNNLEDGIYEIDGKRVFANVQSYKSKPQDEEMMFEAHKDYIDVQYIVKGIEKIRWAKLDKVSLVKEEYSKGNDIAFYEGYAQFDFTLTKGTFLFLEPSDAHLPGLSADKDTFNRKIVFKLHV